MATAAAVPGCPQPLGSTAPGKVLRQAYITFVILKLSLTSILLDKQATAWLQLLSLQLLVMGQTQVRSGTGRRASEST